MSFGRPKLMTVVDHLPNQAKVQDSVFRLDLYKSAVMHYKSLRQLGNNTVTFEEVKKSFEENAQGIFVDEKNFKHYESECRAKGIEPYRF